MGAAARGAEQYVLLGAGLDTFAYRQPPWAGAHTIVEVDHPVRGKYLSVGNPIKLSDSPSEVKRSPLLGEHTDEILREVLGFSDHQVAEIHDSGALDPPRKQAAE